MTAPAGDTHAAGAVSTRQTKATPGTWPRVVNLALFAVLVAGGIYALTLVVARPLIYPDSPWAPDAWNYWRIWHGPMYLEGARLFEKGNIYSPVFGLAMWPLSQLPWPVFAIGWSAAGLATYAWLLAPLALRFRLPLLAMLVMAISAGNIEWLLALVLLGAPAGWALPLLTKITPGLIGPVWFAVRREWRNLAIALGVTAGLVVVSFALMPDQWLAWGRVLADSARLSPTGGSVMPPLFARVPLALALTAWAARTDRAWLLPVAMVVAQPDPTWTTAGLLAAIPRLRTGRSLPEPE